MNGNVILAADGSGVGTAVLMTNVGGVATPAGTAANPLQIAQAAGSGGGSTTAATDTTRLPVSTPDIAPISGSVSAAGVIATLDTTGYSSIVVQVTNAGTGCTVTYEQCNDGATWLPAYGFQPSGSLIGTSNTSSGAALIVFPVVARYFRPRVSVYGSGTVAISGYARDEMASQLDPQVTARSVVLANGTNSVGNVKVFPAGSGGLGVSVGGFTSQAGTNAMVLRAAAASLLSYEFFNSGTTAAYIKFYNKASAPVIGTDAVLFTLGIPPGARAVYEPPFGISNFAAGIAIAATGGYSNADTTALAIGQVVGSFTFA